MPDEIKKSPTLANPIERNTPPPEGDIDVDKKPEQEKIMEREINKPQERTEDNTNEGWQKIKKRLPHINSTAIITPQPKDEMMLEIEKILEEGLTEEYEKLSPIAKQEFRLKGEQTAFKVRELMKSTRVKARKILKLIFDWLRILPGVNRFFLEQEAKIKADRIFQLKEEKNSILQ